MTSSFMNPRAALEARNLCVCRNGRIVWSALSFNVASGTLLCITGNNGSGKTTLLATLAGITQPEQGEVRWCGHIGVTTSRYRSAMAYLAHNNGLNADLTVEDNLRYAAHLANTPGDEATMHDALAQVGMEKHGRRMVKHLSQGQQRRAALARVLLQRAQLWLLDEPFTALDVDASRQFGTAIETHLKQGGIVVAATHQAVPIDMPFAELAL